MELESVRITKEMYMTLRGSGKHRFTELNIIDGNSSISNYDLDGSYYIENRKVEFIKESNK